MGKFLQWLEENGLELPNLDQEAEPTDTEKGEDATSENRARTGWSPNYPPAYFSGQYPQKYVNPKKATADLDKENMGKMKTS